MYSGTVTSKTERPVAKQTMDSLLVIIQIFVSLTLIVVVLMQVKGQGAALFGSAESSYRTRRGIERLLFQFTIALIVVFIGLSIVIASNRF